MLLEHVKGRGVGIENAHEVLKPCLVALIVCTCELAVMLPDVSGLLADIAACQGWNNGMRCSRVPTSRGCRCGSSPFLEKVHPIGRDQLARCL